MVVLIGVVAAVALLAADPVGPLLEGHLTGLRFETLDLLYQIAAPIAVPRAA